MTENPDEVHKVTKSLFKIPLYMRVIKGGSYFCKEVCMELDNVGFFLHYDEDGQQFDHDWIRHHMTGREETTTVVEAENLQDAIHKIINEWEGCKVGGESETAKALWINRKKPILELPPCESNWIRVNRGDLTCGKPDRYGYAGCVHTGFDAPNNHCPGREFYEKISSDYNQETHRWVERVTPDVVIVDGLEYKFITWRSI